MTEEIIPGIKLCCECRFFMSDTGYCGHSSAMVTDYVYGKHTRFRASSHRSFSGKNDCGGAAVHFEPRRIDNVIGAAERFAQPCDVEAAELKAAP